MAKTQRNAYDAAFKLKPIDLAVGKGNRAAAREHGLNEPMIRRWKQQREFSGCGLYSGVLKHLRLTVYSGALNSLEITVLVFVFCLVLRTRQNTSDS